jgi:hypothetical protein
MGKKVIGIARDVVGPTGSWQRRWAVLLSLVIIVGAGLVFVRTVLAVHDTGAFELDGNATQSVSDDWDEVFLGTSDAIASSFNSDDLVGNGPSLQATIFTGGGSKDPQDINQWAWKDGSGGLPDKDNLLHSFAARYSLTPTLPGGSCPNGTGGAGQPAFDPTIPCDVLYFGSDRFDNSGDAQQGFWFFQKQITLGTDSLGGGQSFNGVHEPGDLLIISDFSNGGTVSTITIYTWDPVCTATNKPDGGCGDANLRRLASSAAANCATATAGDAFCGLVNPGPGLTAAPWPFLDKSGFTGFQNGELYEGGINLSLLGLADECFSSIAAESRSSTSTTATLKDFVLGQFAQCTATLTTTPSVGAGGVVAPGTPVTDIATILGAGTANPPTPTGDVTFSLCGPIATGTCTTGGTTVGSPVALASSAPPPGEATATSAAVNTAGSPLLPGRYCFRADWPGDTNYPTALTHAGTADSECFLVQDTTSATSAQDWLPNDSATITAAGGSALSGSLTFQLYTGDNCGVTSGSAVAGQLYTHALSSAASPVTRTTSNTTFKVTATGSFSWKVVFTSSNPNVLSTSKCEKTSLVITN